MTTPSPAKPRWGRFARRTSTFLTPHKGLPIPGSEPNIETSGGSTKGPSILPATLASQSTILSPIAESPVHAIPENQTDDAEMMAPSPPPQYANIVSIPLRGYAFPTLMCSSSSGSSQFTEDLYEDHNPEATGRKPLITVDRDRQWNSYQGDVAASIGHDWNVYGDVANKEITNNDYDTLLGQSHFSE